MTPAIWKSRIEEKSIMTRSDNLSRRSFALTAAGATLGSATAAAFGDDKPAAAPGPSEAPFERDYAPPDFKPSWKNAQLNRQLVQDFVIFAHFDPTMTKQLLEREPRLAAATIDWGGGDWESGLGGAAHMGRRDIVEVLLAHGARIDLFCAAMLGQLDAVRAFLTLEPKLIDARGPHGFNLHFHAQVGGPEAEPVLDYLQSVKRIELKPNPFLKKPSDAPSKP
jgi:hypothetical protein